MAVGTPDTAAQVEERLKADVAREAPDSNPYLAVHWLRSLLAGVGRRIFDFYRDLNRTELRLFPDTADDETAPIWGNIYIGPPNTSTPAGGPMVAGGTVGGVVAPGALLSANGVDYEVQAPGASVTAQNLVITSLTRSGSTATATTASDHNLASAIPVAISGATEPEYNVAAAEITVTGPDTFQYTVEGTPTTPATGAPQADYTTALVEVQSTSFGANTNLDADAPATLQSPIVNVDDTFYVTQGAVGGGTDAEGTDAYKDRYLEKIRDPVAHFNVADIVAKAKEVAGVTRVFVEEAGTEVGTIAITTLTRIDTIAKAVTATPHGFEDGNRTSVNGADQAEYNVDNAPIIVADSVTFYYLVSGSPVTPATGTVTAAATIALGQVRTFFMRDNDADPIPSTSEVDDTRAAIDTIRPATTSYDNNIVAAPVAVPTDFTFSAITPDNQSMRDAVTANLQQFFDEQTQVGASIEEDAYRAAIQNTVDPSNGAELSSFTLSAPSGDITVNSGQIATLGLVAFP